MGQYTPGELADLLDGLTVLPMILTDKAPQADAAESPGAGWSLEMFINQIGPNGPDIRLDLPGDGRLLVQYDDRGGRAVSLQFRISPQDEANLNSLFKAVGFPLWDSTGITAPFQPYFIAQQNQLVQLNIDAIAESYDTVTIAQPQATAGPAGSQSMQQLRALLEPYTHAYICHPVDKSDPPREGYLWEMKLTNRNGRGGFILFQTNGKSRIVVSMSDGRGAAEELSLLVMPEIMDSIVGGFESILYPRPLA